MHFQSRTFECNCGQFVGWTTYSWLSRTRTKRCGSKAWIDLFWIKWGLNSGRMECRQSGAAAAAASAGRRGSPTLQDDSLLGKYLLGPRRREYYKRAARWDVDILEAESRTKAGWIITSDPQERWNGMAGKLVRVRKKRMHTCPKLDVRQRLFRLLVKSAGKWGSNAKAKVPQLQTESLLLITLCYLWCNTYNLWFSKRFLNSTRK